MAYDSDYDYRNEERTRAQRERQRRNANQDHDQSTKAIAGMVDVGDPMLAAGLNVIEDIASTEGIKRLRFWQMGENGQKFIAKIVESPLISKLGLSKGAVGAMVSGVIAGIPAFYKPVVTLGATVSQYGKDLNGLARKIEPVLNANNNSATLIGMMSSSLGNNEVIQVARKQVREGFMSNILQTAASVPQGVIKAFVGLRAANIKGDPGPTDQLIERGLPLIGAGGENYIKSRISSANDFSRKPIALDWIIHLDQHSKTNPGENTIQMPGTHNEVPLEKFVREIFLLHQRNRGEAEIGRKNAEKLDYACGKIADMVRSGKLSSWALVGLVGEREILLPDGQGVAGQAAVDKVIEKHRAKMPAHYSVDVTQYLEDSLSNDEDIKGLLSTLKEKDRDLFVLVHPQNVMEKVGVTKKEYTEIEQRMSRLYPQMLWQVTQDMASMSDKELKKVGFEAREINFLRRTARDTLDEPHDSILQHVSTHGLYKQGIEFLVAQHSDYWRSLANGESKIGSLAKKAKTDRALSEDDAPERGEDEEMESFSARRGSRHARGGTRSERGRGDDRDMAMDEAGEEPDPRLMAGSSRAYGGRTNARGTEREWMN